VRRTLGPPFSLAAIKLTLARLHDLPELLKGLDRVIRQPDMLGRKDTLFACGNVHDARESVEDLGRTAARSSAANTPRALEIFAEAGPIAGTIAMTYLASRGIGELPPDVHEVLRFHPPCPYRAGERPCIVALLRDVQTNKPQAISRTALKDGTKLERAHSLGPSGGAVIKVWPDEDVELGLVAGEGLETVLAAAMMVKHRGTLLQPAWALGSANNIRDFPVLPGIEALTILVDNDESGTSQLASEECSKRWVAAGCEVIRLTPRGLGADFNDIIRSTTP
jgi:hypothetical protein